MEGGNVSLDLTPLENSIIELKNTIQQMANTIGGLSLSVSNTPTTPLFTQEVPLSHLATLNYPVTTTSQGLITSQVFPSSGILPVIPLTLSQLTAIANAKKAVYQYKAVGSEKFYVRTDGQPATATDGESTNLVGNEFVSNQIPQFQFKASVNGGTLVVILFG